MFITFEGPDGSGKTTVLKQIIPWMEQEFQKEVLLTREPGGTPIGEEIRQLLLKERQEAVDPWTEALLFIAARRQHVVEVILPALNEKKIVVSDRFMDSTTAYQGSGRELGLDQVDQVQQLVLEQAIPDLTIYFQLKHEEALKRLDNREVTKDRLENETDAYRQRVEKGYETLIANHPNRFKVVDANGPIDAVVENVKKIILESLK